MMTLGLDSTKHPKTMTALEYAKKYKISVRTVYRWVNENRLPSHMIMVEELDIEDVRVRKKPRYKLPPRYKK